MTITYAGLCVQWKSICPEVMPVISTTSASGNAAYLIDTNLLSDTNALQMSAQTLSRHWIDWPAASPITDRERRVGGNSGAPLDLTNGRLYPSFVWGTLPGAAVTYRLSLVRPKDMFDQAVISMEQLLLPELDTFQAFTDANMEASGTTSYSLSGAGSLSKVTTAANVQLGAQSLFFNTATAGEYLETPSIRVREGRQHFVSCILRVDAGGPAEFAVYDQTNGAEIDSSSRVTHSRESFYSMQRTFTPPSGCEEVRLRVYCTAATDDFYIDRFIGPYSSSDEYLDAPSLLRRNVDFRKLMVANYSDSAGAGLLASRGRMLEEFPANTFQLRPSYHHANPLRVEFKRGYHPPMQEMYIESLIHPADKYTLAFTAAGETAPAVGIEPARVLALDSMRRIIEAYCANEPWAKMRLGRINEELNPLLEDMEQDLETRSEQPGWGLRVMGGI